MNTHTLMAALALGLTACSAASSAPQASTLFAQPWNSGTGASEPAFHVQAINPNSFAIRQSIASTFEAPFVYLLIGRDRALLIDSGDKDAALRPEIDRLLKANGRDSLPLIVMHSHGHGDHVGGDAGFRDRPATTIIGHAPTDVATFFGMKDWPAQTASFDLGDRIVDIIPTPGHHPAHVMVFDRATRILFSGDAIYPGRLYFQCGLAAEYRASIDRLAKFVATSKPDWLLGAHVEMRSTPGQSFEGGDRVRHDEHRLELAPTVITEIQQALTKMAGRVRVEAHDDFILFPHPADPRGLTPPDWCPETRPTP